MLFASASGKAYALNASSEFIGERLSRGISLEELLAQMCARYPNENPDELKRSLCLYLGQLKTLGYIEGFDGKAVDATPPPSDVLPDGAKSNALPENHLLYKGNSMARVFVLGDILVVKDLPLEEFSRGDIVAFKFPDAKDGIVHRIVKMAADGFVTMGDNNSVPDGWIVTVADRPRLVVERIDVAGRHHCISRGRVGMLAFRWHRCRYWTRRLLSKIYRFVFPR